MLVDKELVTKLIFKDLFNDDKYPNMDIIKGIIIENTSSSALEFIMNIMLNSNFELLYPGDYFKTELPDKYIGSSCEIDHLIDMGLYKDGYVYGKVIDSDGYDSSFRPYYPSMKVQLFFHNEEIMMTPHNATIETHKLIKLDKSNIKYFNHAAD